MLDMLLTRLFVEYLIISHVILQIQTFPPIGQRFLHQFGIFFGFCFDTRHIRIIYTFVSD